MAELVKPAVNRAASRRPAAVSSYRDRVCVMLTLLADFGRELKLGDAVLRIEVDTDALDLPSCPDAHLSRCLQEHISKLQAVSESLSTLVATDALTSSTRDGTSDDAVASSSLKDRHPPGSEAAESTAAASAAADDVMVQIRAKNAEIERRISAFMERKQMEINENNVREFCNVIDCNQVTRVVNMYGPQTRGGGQGGAGEQQRGPMARDCGNAAIEERLHNIETHLKLPAVGPVPLSVYQRLKKLEDRILELEGLSPEYFQSMSHLHKRPKTSVSQACSLTELDQKISAVKAALLKRVNEFGPGYDSL